MMWGIATHYNACKYARTLENFHKFAQRARDQGLRLVALEVAFGDEPFSLHPDVAEKLVQLRSDSILWHKERLFNIALRHLPDDCDAVCWLDGDVLFDNPNWVSQTRKALNTYKLVQPFEYCVWLPPGTEYMSREDTDYPAHSKEGGRLHSFGFGWRNFGKPALEAALLHGHPGFAWASRRDVIESVGFYDTAIVGSGDALMAHAFVGSETALDGSRYPPNFVEHYRRWFTNACGQVQGSVGYTEGTVFHLWHGLSKHRGYRNRLRQLMLYDFDPAVDITVGESALYEWATDKSELVEFVSEYFVSRREDFAPDDLHNFVYQEGFFEDEGGFRWCASYATLQLVRDVESWRFRVTNNALHRFDRTQNVSIEKNDRTLLQISMRGNTHNPVELTGLKAGDTIRFTSDFEFSPRSFGNKDNRTLSFMIVSD